MLEYIILLMYLNGVITSFFLVPSLVIIGIMALIVEKLEK